jgi:two-component system, NtrC family, C4-dicarboxylate transport sensor histidine kinase DctB
VNTETTQSRPAVELRARRYDLVSRLADDLAHEIKNPLHAMVINLEVLRRRVSAGAADAALERADVIEHELHRVHRLIDQVLQLLRPERSTIATTAVDSIVGDILPLIEIRARAARLTFRYEPAGAGTVVRVRAESLKLALLALSAAAVAAGPERDGVMVLRSEDGGGIRICFDVETAAKPLLRETDESLTEAIEIAGSLLEEFGGAARIETATLPRTLTLSLTLPGGAAA